MKLVALVTSIIYQVMSVLIRALLTLLNKIIKSLRYEIPYKQVERFLTLLFSEPVMLMCHFIL